MQESIDALFDRIVSEKSLGLTDSESHPNLNGLALRLRNVDNLALNIKFFGYELARRLAKELPPRTDLSAAYVGLKSKPSTQTDMESDWVAYWCSQLKTPVVFHRKLWELSYVLQALYDHGHIRKGARALGFGCGQEPIPSYLAAAGVMITVTDIPPDRMEAAGWAASGQHSASLEQAFREHLVSREQFERNVNFKFVDMNEIPESLRNYDFCWSVCALEHIGSIRAGLDFIANSIDTLRPGGLAVHTTEFNFSNDKETIDNWPTVLFQRKHFQQLAADLQSRGHSVAELDFDVGHKPLDRFIDLPPFSHDWPEQLRKEWSGDEAHIKISIDGFPATCFGLIVKKGHGGGARP